MFPNLFTKHFNHPLSLCLRCLLFLSVSCTKVNEKETVAASASQKENNTGILAMNHPNIILVLGDDIGYEVPTFTGGQSYQTPVLDRMAGSGMQFTKCFSQPMCSPSRFEVLTGKYNHRNYFGDSWSKLDLSQRTIANMLQDAGYATCIAGKWQLDGGDNSIHTFGFDKYSITDPFKKETYERGELNFYKDPNIYQNGRYLPTVAMKGKYGEDVNRDYLFSFIDSNKSHPFFAMWTPNLCHAPFSPTPDDPEFATWDPLRTPKKGDPAFFPSMVAYFDKEVGMLVSKLSSSGLLSNTIILLAIGDNGTDDDIVSLYNGKQQRGGKGYTHSRGTHVPMIAFCPAKIKAGQINNNLVDFTDILPTLAGFANIPVPTDYGVLDGLSFAPQVLGKPYTPRSFCFAYYDANRWGPDDIPPSIYAFDYTYKRYEDSLNSFFNYVTDISEKNRILPRNMTHDQQQSYVNLDSVIHAYIP